jgi:hypothetical protein
MMFSIADRPLDQVELLEDEAEGAAADLGQEALGQPGDVLAFQAHAALGRPRQAADDGQQGGLARAAGAAQGGDLVRLDAQVDAVERPVLVVTALVEGLADVTSGSRIPAILGWIRRWFATVKHPRRYRIGPVGRSAPRK